MKPLKFIYLATCNLLLATLFLSCSEESPDLNNPWDENNPNRPRTPEGLVATAVSETEVSLTWRDLSGNEDGFDVYEQVEGEEDFFVIASTVEDEDSVLLQDKAPNTKYVYWIRAFNDYGSSDSSSLARVTTPDFPPEAPGNLTAGNIPETDIILTWQDRSHNETEFQIYESFADTLNFVMIMTADEDDTTVTVTDRQPYTTYYYRISAVNDFGESDFTAIAWSTPAAYAPVAPSNLIATAISGTEIILSWQDNSASESGFEIYQREEDDQNFHLINTTAANTTIDTLTERQEGTTYFYRIRAINRWGQSEYSNIVSATTEDLQPPPNAPSNLTASAISTSEIVLTWQDTNGNEGNIEIYLSMYNNENYNLIKTVSADATTDTISSLQHNTTYFFRLRAANLHGQSYYSVTVSAVTHEETLQPPSNPSPSDGALDQPVDIVLSWECDNPPEDSLVYDIYFGSSQNPPHIGYNQIEMECHPGSLEYEQVYFWRIVAHNERGQSTTGPLWSFTTVEMEALPIPSALQFEILEDSTSIRLFWDYEGDIDYFECWEENTLIDTAHSSEISIVNLKRGTPYWFRIRAILGNIFSGFSEVCEVSIPEPVPIYETDFEDGMGEGGLWSYLPDTESRIVNAYYHSAEYSLSIHSTYLEDYHRWSGPPVALLYWEFVENVRVELWVRPSTIRTRETDIQFKFLRDPNLDNWEWRNQTPCFTVPFTWFAQNQWTKLTIEYSCSEETCIFKINDQQQERGFEIANWRGVNAIRFYIGGQSTEEYEVHYDDIKIEEIVN